MDKQLRVFLLNQDANTANATQEMLKSAGFSLRAQRISDKEQFATALAKEPPELILVDADHSPVSVNQAVRSAQHAKAAAPVVVIGGREEHLTYLQQGAHDVLEVGERELCKLIVMRALHLQQLERDLQQCRANLAESERRAKALLDTSRDAIAYVHDGMHLYANNAYLELFAFEDLDEIAGLPILDMVADTEQQRFKEFLRSYSRTEQDLETFETKLKDINGRVFDARMEFTPANVEGEACTQITIRNQDLEQYILERDPVTGLFNRRYFIGQLTEAANRATSGSQLSALLQAEITNFQDLRDQVGVANSDQVLTQIGQTIAAHFGDQAITARFETATFTTITPYSLESELQQAGENLVARLDEQIIEVSGQALTCKLAVSITSLDEDSPNADELLARTAQTMKRAMAASKRVALYQPKQGEMTQRQLDRRWQTELQQAMDEDRLRLLYQPLVNLQGDTTARYEVFMRLLDQAGKTVAAKEFLPSAERSGIARELDLWVLRHGLAEISATPGQPHAETILFIKLTAGSLQSQDVQAWLAEHLRQSGLAGQRLVLELKESTVQQYLTDAKAFIPKVRALGCGIALDDCGEQGDSLSLLNHIDIDYLKLATSFMGALRKSSENQKTVRDLIQRTHEANRQVIAQHVDDAQDLQLLWSFGVDFIQGNFLQPPAAKMNYDFSVLTG